MWRPSDRARELSPPQRLPLGIPIKKKIESARGTMGSAPRSLFFFLPSLPTTQKPPHNTKSPLRRREARERVDE